MKTTGRQWNAFLASWPDGWWYDDADVTVNGVDENDASAPQEIPDTAKVELTSGTIFEGPSYRDAGRSLVRQFRKWERAKKYDTFMVEVPKTVDRHHFETRLHALFGAKVVKP